MKVLASTSFLQGTFSINAAWQAGWVEGGRAHKQGIQLHGDEPEGLHVHCVGRICVQYDLFVRMYHYLYCTLATDLYYRLFSKAIAALSIVLSLSLAPTSWKAGVNKPSLSSFAAGIDTAGRPARLTGTVITSLANISV